MTPCSMLDRQQYFRRSSYFFGQVIRYFFSNRAYPIAFNALRKEAEFSPIRLYLCMKRKEEFPPYVGIYIYIYIYIHTHTHIYIYTYTHTHTHTHTHTNKSRSFLRTLAHIYETKGEVSSVR